MYRPDPLAENALRPGEWIATPFQAALSTKGGPAVRPVAQPIDLRRGLDVGFSLLAVTALLPLLIIISLLIKLQDGGPILFAQLRIGKGGRRFQCFKFRSMRPDAEAYLAELLATNPQFRGEWQLDHKLKRDPRITKLGDFLRRSSLDELPQLFNILSGQMSIVGPRPIVEAEIARYGRWYRYYTAVKPGLTGLWQVSGRNDVGYKRRVAMDRLFARTQSTALFLFILFATVPAVLGRRGAY